MKVRCACGDVRAYENGLAKRSGFVNPGLHTPASQSMVVIRTVKYVQSCIAHRSNGEIAASLRHPFGSTIDREVLNRPMAEGSLLPILSVSFQRVLCSGANVRIGHGAESRERLLARNSSDCLEAVIGSIEIFMNVPNQIDTWHRRHGCFAQISFRQSLISTSRPTK